MDLSLTLIPRYTQLGGGAPTPPGDDEGDLFTTYAVAATIAFSVVVFLLEAYLSLRQRSTFYKTSFPEEISTTVGSIDAEREKEPREVKEPEPAWKSSWEAKVLNTREDGSKPPRVSIWDEQKRLPDQPVTEEDDGVEEKDRVDKDAPLLPQIMLKFMAAQLYGLDKINFSLFSSTYSTIEGFAFVLLGFFPFIWDLACSIGSERFGWTETDNEIKISLLFLGLNTVIGTVTSLPFEWYSTFRIEKKHGFNKQTLGLFLVDKVKGLFLTALFGGPFAALLLRIITWGGDHFYLYVWAFTSAFSVLMMTLVPVVIMPMFNKYEKLPDGSLKDQIYKLAGRLEFPLTKLFVMDGSKRSSHSNAFMFGFFKNKRIVLFDTLMEQVHDDEVLAILGHELGHWKMGHTVTNFVISQTYMGAAFYCFSLCFHSEGLYSAFGFNDPSRPVPIVIALILFFSTVFEPIDKALSYVMTVHSRKCEFEADEFSVNLGMSSKLQSGLCKIHLENLGAMCPDPWYSAYHYSHPPLVERLSAIMKLDKKSK